MVSSGEKRLENGREKIQRGKAVNEAMEGFWRVLALYGIRVSKRKRRGSKKKKSRPIRRKPVRGPLRLRGEEGGVFGVM